MSKIYSARIKKGQSVSEAAEIIGVSDVCWRYWESGRKTPNDANKRKLIKWSDNFLTLEDLIGGDLDTDHSSDNVSASSISPTTGAAARNGGCSGQEFDNSLRVAI